LFFLSNKNKYLKKKIDFQSFNQKRAYLDFCLFLKKDYIKIKQKILIPIIKKKIILYNRWLNCS
jgi:hypothetical protein